MDTSTQHKGWICITVINGKPAIEWHTFALKKKYSIDLMEATNDYLATWEYYQTMGTVCKKVFIDTLIIGL